jgi:hypothetical protein
VYLGLGGDSGDVDRVGQAGAATGVTYIYIFEDGGKSFLSDQMNNIVTAQLNLNWRKPPPPTPQELLRHFQTT